MSDFTTKAWTLFPQPLPLRPNVGFSYGWLILLLPQFNSSAPIPPSPRMIRDNLGLSIGLVFRAVICDHVNLQVVRHAGVGR